jgi:transporter family-2 protein
MSTMLRFLLPALAVTAGVAAACQAAANSALAARASLGAALFLNTAIVWAGTFILMLASGGPVALRALPGAPPHHYIAGLCGFVVIASITFVLPRLGAAVTLALMVLGQGAMALAVDLRSVGSAGGAREPDPPGRRRLPGAGHPAAAQVAVGGNRLHRRGPSSTDVHPATQT